MTASGCPAIRSIRPRGRGVGGQKAEQRRLLADRAEVRERLAAVGEHYRQVADDAARIAHG